MANDYPCLGLHFQARLVAGPAVGDDGSFQEASGLSAKMDTESYHEGGENRFDLRLPTGVKYEPLKLSAGVLASDRPLARWCCAVLQGNLETPVQPQPLLLSLLDGGQPLKSWMFYRAWPVRWEIAGFNSTEGKLLVETLELSYDYFSPQTPP